MPMPVCQSPPVDGRTIRLAIGVAGTLAALAGESFAISTGTPPETGLLQLAIGLTYLYGGLVIWDHEPANRTGRLMTLVGLTWFIGTLIGSPISIVNELALALEDTSAIILLALVLSYPSGRLETRVDRAAVAVLAVGVTALNILYSTDLTIIADKSSGLYGGLALAIMTSVVVLRRWLLAPARQRQDLLPVLVAGAVFLTTLIINIVRRIADVPEDAAAILVAAKDLAPAAIPIALLIGFYRQSEHRLQGLVDAIPDQMVRFSREGRYIDAGAGERGRRVYEAMVGEAPDSVTVSAGRALDTGRLQAFDFSLGPSGGRHDFEARIAPSGADEVTAIIRDFTDQRAAEAELRRSRARIVEATDAERRRLERDLHDGAQQRLVSLSLAIRLLRQRLVDEAEPREAAVAAADAAAAELKLAIAELRELARGIHPAILTEAGLGAAIMALADRSAVPATVSSVPDRRLTPAIEATAYFVISEALANIGKYASATRASIGAECRGSVLHVEIGDDGVGGADGARGTGIRGLRDRVAAIGGTLTVDSPSGQGTLVVAELPIP
jgi:signal transduction histidine kinase